MQQFIEQVMQYNVEYVQVYAQPFSTDLIK
jgi:hypothetical protein